MFDLFVGVDWGQTEHRSCVLSAAGEVRQERRVAHSAPELHRLVDEWLALSGGPPARIAVAIEVPHGVVVDTLVERGVAVFAINPKQLDRFRDRYTMAGAKDDRRDARVLADALRTDRRAFKRLELAAAELVELREDSRLHDELRGQWVQLGNRMRDQLLRYYPQLLALGTVDEPWLWELWTMAPSPAAAQRLRPGPRQALLKRHRIRRCTAPEVLAQLRGPAFSAAPGVVPAASRHIEVLLAPLRLLHQQLKACEQRLDSALTRLGNTPREQAPPNEPSDAKILLSLPGVGNLVAAAVLAEVGAPLTACERSMLRPRCGLAPVTKRSGKMCLVQMRSACHPRLRNACHYWGSSAVQHDERARALYHRLRARGCTHARAIRGVVDRLLDVLLAMLRDRTVYDPTRYAAAAARQTAT
jgi:transposase